MAQHQLQLLQLGILLVFAGIIAIFISLAAAKDKGGNEKGSFKFSIVGFFGFIPFGFGNDKKLLTLGIALTIAFAILTAVAFSRMKP